MKRVINFLCRFPGLFVISAIILTALLFLYREELDERKIMLLFTAIAFTFVSNIYLFFIQGEKLGWYIKGAKWLGIGTMSLFLALTSLCLFGLYSQETMEFPSDYYLQRALLESFLGILLWAIFALIWNMNTFSILEEKHLKRFKNKSRILLP